MSAAENEVQQPSGIAQVNTVVAEFDRVAAGIGELKQKYANVVYDVATTAGMKAASQARAAIRAPRYEIEKVRKAVKAPLLALGKEIDARAAAIKAELFAIEDPIDSQITAREEQLKAEELRKENERKAKVAAELKRVEDIQTQIQAIIDIPSRSVGRPSKYIADVLANLASMHIAVEGFAEFTANALAAKDRSLATLTDMRAKQLAHETEQQRLADERAELARQREANEFAAKAERERIAQEAAEAKRKADAEAAAAKVERERIQAEEAAERARKQAQEDEARRQRQAVEDEERRKREADQAIADHERKRKLDEELAALRAENERIAEAQRVELERRRAEQDAKDKAEADRLAAERAEIDARRAELDREEAELQQRQAPAVIEQPVAHVLTATEPESDAVSSFARQPGADELISLVADHFIVSPDMAGKWLRDAFAPVIA